MYADRKVAYRDQRDSSRREGRRRLPEHRRYDDECKKTSLRRERRGDKRVRRETESPSPSVRSGYRLPLFRG